MPHDARSGGGPGAGGTARGTLEERYDPDATQCRTDSRTDGRFGQHRRGRLGRPRPARPAVARGRGVRPLPAPAAPAGHRGPRGRAHHRRPAGPAFGDPGRTARRGPAHPARPGADPGGRPVARIGRDAGLAVRPGRFGVGVGTAGQPVRHAVDRYAMQWTSAELPDLVQMKSASAETGRLHLMNLTDWTAHTASGYAQAGIGILVRPSHKLCRLTFRADASYTFRHMIDTPSVPG